MSKIVLIIFGSFLFSAVNTESIYTYSVPTIEGHLKQMSDYQGKKILIVTLPVQQNAAGDSMLFSLDSLRAVHAGTLTVIGVPAYEDGYTSAIKEQLRDWYMTRLDTAVIISEGLYTRKTSGTQQHPLFQWLTMKEKNGHFDQDISGVQNKFFVWTDGQLLAVLGTLVKIKSSVINSLIE